MNKADILMVAHKAVSGDRGKTHGDAYDNMRHTAAMWNAYLDGRSGITPLDVAHMMVLHKQSRSMQGSGDFLDHYVDQCGYAAIAGEVATREKRVYTGSDFNTHRKVGSVFETPYRETLLEDVFSRTDNPLDKYRKGATVNDTELGCVPVGPKPLAFAEEFAEHPPEIAPANALEAIIQENLDAAAATIEPFIEVRGFKVKVGDYVKFWPKDDEWKVDALIHADTTLPMVRVRHYETNREHEMLASKIHSVVDVA